MSENTGEINFSRQDAPWERGIVSTTLGLQYVGGVFLVALMVLTVIHAMGRYFFGKPIPGLVEMSSFMLVVIIFLTGAYTEIQKGHTVIGIVLERLSERTQAIIDSITYILSLAFVVVAIWRTVAQGVFLMGAEYESAVLGIPHAPFLFVVALGWLMLGLAILVNLIHSCRRAVRRVR